MLTVFLSLTLSAEDFFTDLFHSLFFLPRLRWAPSKTGSFTDALTFTFLMPMVITHIDVQCPDEVWNL